MGEYRDTSVLPKGVASGSEFSGSPRMLEIAAAIPGASDKVATCAIIST
jgi:hypothetical protein